jgi:hypothetical protein
LKVIVGHRNQFVVIMTARTFDDKIEAIRTGHVVFSKQNEVAAEYMSPEVVLVRQVVTDTPCSRTAVQFLPGSVSVAEPQIEFKKGIEYLPL